MAADNSDQIPLFMSILAVILAVIAIIIGAVSISQNNNSSNIVIGNGGMFIKTGEKKPFSCLI